MTNRLYFGYGSNLNQDDLRRRCEEDNIPMGTLTPRGVAYLPDRELAFTRRSMSRKGGVLDVRPRLGQAVAGVVFEADKTAWDMLDIKEGPAYERFDTVALDEDGAEIPVTTYGVQEALREDFVPPTPEYVEIVRAGLESHGLPTDALEAAAAGRRTPPLPGGLFVYGTLMRGESRFDVLKPFGLECVLLAQAPGRLLDLNSYPGMVNSSGGEDLVHGEFVRPSDMGGAVAKLDEIERFNGFGVPGSLFRRTMITVDVGDGRIRTAWTYLYAGDGSTADEVRSGDWRQHHGRRERFLRDLVFGHVGFDQNRVAAEIAGTIPFSMADNRAEVVSSLLPLEDAVERGDLSERRLAQHSGQWAVTTEVNR